MSAKEPMRSLVAPQMAMLARTALWHQRKADLLAANARLETARDAHWSALRQANEETPPPSDICIMRHVEGDRYRTIHQTEDEIRRACVWGRTGDDYARGAERALRLIGLARAWVRYRAKRYEELRVRELGEERQRARDALTEARKALAATPAPTAAAIAEKVALCAPLWGNLAHDNVSDPLAIGEAVAGDASDGDGLAVAIYLDALRLAEGDEAVSRLVQAGREAYAADLAQAETEAADPEPETDSDGFSAREFWRQAKELGAFFYHDRGVYGWRFPQPLSDAARALRAQLADDPSKGEAVLYVARADWEGGDDA